MLDTEAFLAQLFGLKGQVAVVTGGSGVLGRAVVRGLGRVGARVGVLGRHEHHLTEVVREVEEAGGQALALVADVLSTEQLEAARDVVLENWGTVTVLVNLAGGNLPGATASGDRTPFDLPMDALRQAIDLNLLGTILPCQVFGPVLVEAGGGCVVNVSSSSVQRALSGVMPYSASKAGVENFTRWLAVDLARRYGPNLRVNAVAPGFFVAEQNRDLLLDADGLPNSRGRSVLAHTPAGRFGDPDDLVSTVIWLCGPGAAFVTGAIVPVDGGFGAFSGV